MNWQGNGDCITCPMLAAYKAETQAANARADLDVNTWINELAWHKQRIEELEIELNVYKHAGLRWNGSTTNKKGRTNL